jgi:hypothetical protein
MVNLSTGSPVFVGTMTDTTLINAINNAVSSHCLGIYYPTSCTGTATITGISYPSDNNFGSGNDLDTGDFTIGLGGATMFENQAMLEKRAAALGKADNYTFGNANDTHGNPVRNCHDTPLTGDNWNTHQSQNRGTFTSCQISQAIIISYYNGTDVDGLSDMIWATFRFTDSAGNPLDVLKEICGDLMGAIEIILDILGMVDPPLEAAVQAGTVVARDVVKIVCGAVGEAAAITDGSGSDGG